MRFLDRLIRPVLVMSVLVFADSLVLAVVKEKPLDGSVPYGTADWPRILGNHRAVIEVTTKEDATMVDLEWRRMDDPTAKDRGIIVTALGSDKRIKNCAILNQSRETATIAFEPVNGPGKYAIYYYPLRRDADRATGKRDFVHYKPRYMADRKWLDKYGFGPARYYVAGQFDNVPKAKVLRIEARSRFDSFYPMQVIAKKSEVDEIKSYHTDSPFLVFPEVREHPIRMWNDIPYRWVRKGPADLFKARARPDEYFVFQLGVFACFQELTGLTVVKSDLTSDGGSVIPASAIQSINTEGVDALGKPWSRVITVGKDKVQALWFLVRVPREAKAGKHSGTVEIKTDQGVQKVRVELTVAGKPLDDHGLSDPDSLARLAWLNTTSGVQGDLLSEPFGPMGVKGGRTITCTGKTVRFSAAGLPTSMKADETEILAKPIRFTLYRNGKPLTWARRTPAKVVEQKKSSIRWESMSAHSLVTLSTRVRMEYDGYAYYSLTVKANRDVDLSDTTLEIPIRKEIATYLMGLDTGQGGYRPEEVNYKWMDYPNNKVWIGDVAAGIRCKFRGDANLEHIWSQESPEVTGIVKSWDNGGKGRITVKAIDKETVMLKAFTGARTLKKDQQMQFNFSLMITPIKPRDPQHWVNPKSWSYRFSMMGCNPETNALLGANNVTAFHGSYVNPWINYPLLTSDRIRRWVRQAHQFGLKARLYYKIGELSNHAKELWVLRSLGDEVLDPNTGGGKYLGSPWLREHLPEQQYRRAWYCSPEGLNRPADSSIRVTGMSRWNNFYVGSLEWMIANYDIDGLYYDGLGYSRQLLQRVRKVFDRDKPGSVLDHHNGNTITHKSNAFNDGMEHLAFFDCTWIGEGFNYDGGPDLYMVELSGIPFGVPNNMLQFGGNPWKGMIYGMSTRYIENHTGTPTPMWRFWDDIQIQNSRMIGYWDKECPVKTDNKNVLATVYRFKDKALVAIASWDGVWKPTQAKLAIDYKALGLDPKTIVAYAPEIPEFQPPRAFDLSKPIPIAANRGWLILLQNKPAPDLRTRFERQGLVARPVALKHDGNWQLHNLKGSKGRVSIKDGQLQLQAPMEAASYLERKIPRGVSGVQCDIKFDAYLTPKFGPWWHKRFDGLQAPGISIVFDDGRSVRLWYASKHVFNIDDSFTDASFKKSLEPWGDKDPWDTVRIWWDDENIYCQELANGKTWNTLRVIPSGIFKGRPVAVRIGKMTKPYGWPRTLRISNEGRTQVAEYANVKFWIRP